MELAGEAGQKCLVVVGVRRGEGRFCDLSESGEPRRFMSRHLRDLGVIPLLTLSGVTLDLSGVLIITRPDFTLEVKNDESTSK